MTQVPGGRTFAAAINDAEANDTNRMPASPRDIQSDNQESDPEFTFAKPNARRTRLLEAGMVILMVAALIAQLMTYTPMYDNDPDGYISYANYLLAEGKLMPDYLRLPGYPMFLVLVNYLPPESIHDDVWWAQGTMMVLLAIGSWACVRRWCGPLPAAILLSMLAAPSYYTRMSVVVLTDMVYSVLMLPLLLTIAWWTFKPGPRASWLWCLPFALGLLVAQTIRPTTLMLALFLGPAVFAGYAVSRALRDKAGQVSVRQLMARTLAIMLLAVGAFVVVDAYLDTGARGFNAMVFTYRVVLALPPAADTPAERRVESGKTRFEEIEGQPLWSSRFFSYRKYKAWEEISSDDTREVWRARLLQWPGLYLLSILNDLKYNQYFVLAKFTPYFMDLNHTHLFVEYFPPPDDSTNSRLFRATGLAIYTGPEAPPSVVNGEVGKAVVKVIAVWSLVVLGVWRLARGFCGLTVTFTVMMLGFSLSLSATNTMDARYLLPFAMLIYLAEAMGLAWIVRCVLAQRGVPVKRSATA